LEWARPDEDPLNERRKFLKSVLKLRSPIRISEQFDISADDMISAVREQGLEGVVAKRKDSLYEPGKRSGTLGSSCVSIVGRSLS
jgi:bifunctional non-homologous end joining protein LigD